MLPQDLELRSFQLKQKLNLSGKKDKLAQLKKESAAPSFWADSELAGQKMRQISILSKEIDQLAELDLYIEEGDLPRAEQLLGDLETKIFLSGKYDLNDVVFSIHAGQGGTEAMDWAGMLERMYRRYFDNQGWKCIDVESVSGEEAGVKSVTFQVFGEYAYGYLKGEAGVHRLVRLSPFNANNLRQTSFALVEVTPLIDDSVEVDLKEDDIEFQATQSSGHGGQNVNKVSTAVRLKHIPTGIAVSCQMERSQLRNRQIAMQLLRSKLVALEEDKNQQLRAKLKGEHQTPGWGRQIRSYVLQPYKLVKDLRTEVESTNPDDVLDGNINSFIQAELRLGI